MFGCWSGDQQRREWGDQQRRKWGDQQRPGETNLSEPYALI